MTIDIHTLKAKCGGLLMTKETTLQKMYKNISFTLKCEKNSNELSHLEGRTTPVVTQDLPFWLKL